jgi:hypothetical protein
MFCPKPELARIAAMVVWVRRLNRSVTKCGARFDCTLGGARGPPVGQVPMAPYPSGRVRELTGQTPLDR